MSKKKIQKSKKNNDQKSLSADLIIAGKYISLGWIMVIPIIAFTFVGSLIDKKFNLPYLLTFIGLIIGLSVGIIGTVRILKMKNQ